MLVLKPNTTFFLPKLLYILIILLLALSFLVDFI
jgi:flagellar biosynthesis protein FliQ